MWYLIPIGLFLLSAFLVFYMKFHQQIVIERTRFTSKVFLYEQYVGAYQNVGKVFERIGKEITPHFEGCLSGGIFYDAPSMVADVSASRAVVGIILDPSQEKKAKDYAAKHSNLNVVLLPEIDAVRTTYLWRNPLSFFWAAKKVYPQIHAFIAKEKLDRKRNAGMLEVYHFQQQPGTVELITPIGHNSLEFFLTTAPTPLARGEVRKST